ARADGAPDLSGAPLEAIIEEKVREFVRRLGPALEDEHVLHELFVRQMEKPLIKVLLEATGGNQIKAASILGINRNTLRKKIADLGLARARKGGRRK
ncbi:MAG TPA: helix-turn-helix domain-containing protein, partial [Candidatus Deferrimicrobiaceae bacterium]